MKCYELIEEKEKKLKDNTIGSIVGLPDNMILLVAENSNPTMTLKELNDRMAGRQRTENGVMAE